MLSAEDPAIPIGACKKEKEKEEDKTVAPPPVLSWFIGLLPAASSFDGMWDNFQSSDNLKLMLCPYLVRPSIPHRRLDASIS